MGASLGPDPDPPYQPTYGFQDRPRRRTVPRTNGSKTPIEAKVKAATGGASAGTIIAGFIVFLLDQYVFTSDDPVPAPVYSLIFLLVPAVLTFAAGYYAKHTYRPDLGEMTQGEAL